MQLLNLPIPWPYLLALILLLGVIVVLLYPVIESFFIFYPERSFINTPETLNIPYENVFFYSRDNIRLHGWFFPLEKPKAVILLCHGNAGNISYWLEHAGALLKQRLAVFIFDYRGYGHSYGKPSERGIHLDGLAAYDYLIEEKGITPDAIIPFGCSLGAAVALELAGNREIRALILEGAFTSTKDMARHIPLYRLFAPIIPAHYNNLEKIPQVQVPKLIIHGDRDEIVPFSMGKRLFEAAQAPKYFLPIRSAGHNDIYEVGGTEYYRILGVFATDLRI